MPRPMGHIRILMSARVLLDLEKADSIYKEKGEAAYTDYMYARGRYRKDSDPDVGGRRLSPGPLWHFAVAAERLNNTTGQPLVEIGLSCKDTAETAKIIYRNIDLMEGAEVSFRMATAGNPLESADHEMFETDMLLTRNVYDAQYAVNQGLAAAVINFPPSGGAAYERRKADEPLRLWVDGDAVAFGSSAEVSFRENGLEAYRKDEFNAFAAGIEPGPFTAILAKISQLNAALPRAEQPFLISLLTARGGAAAARVCTIAQQHGIVFNERMIWMGGASKAAALKAHRPDLYLDDQMVHLADAARYCPTGLVAYPENSPMHNYLKAQMQKGKGPGITP